MNLHGLLNSAYASRMWFASLNPMLQFIAVVPVLIIYWVLPQLFVSLNLTKNDTGNRARFISTSRQMILLLASVAFYWYLDASRAEILGLVALTVITFLFSVAIRRCVGPRRLQLTVFAISIVLLWLIAFKYLNSIVSGVMELNAARGQGHLHHLAILAPLGISYYTFRIISYLVEVYTEESPNVTLLEFCTYIMFAPTLIAGPIERIGPFHEQGEKIRFSIADFREGFPRIIYGVAKKVILADLMCGFLFGLPEGGRMPPWYSLILFFLFLPRLYWDFGGYSDIAIGTARLFGYRIVENFDRPYLASNLQQFWQRWHISLSSWIRDYVYYPVVTMRFARRWGQKWVYISILLSMALFGVWHGARVGYLWFGLLQGLGLVAYSVYKSIVERRSMEVPKRFSGIALHIGRLVTLAYVSATFWLCFDPGWSSVPRAWMFHSMRRLLQRG